MSLITQKTFLLLAIVCFNISQVHATLSEMNLKDKLTAKLTIKDVEVDTDGYQLKIEVTIKNLTQQTLQYQRKSIDTMLNLFVYDHKGLGLNMDELKVIAKSRNSLNIPIESQPKAHYTFYLS